MSSRIYYFSGTGNSLAVTKKLEDLLLVKGSILPLSILNNKEIIEVDTDILGIVFPVYFMNIPDIVKSFVEKLSFKTDPYIFAVATCNGVPGHSFYTLNKYLKVKGKMLSLGSAIDMPGNAIITPPEIEVDRLNNYTTKVAEIAHYINIQSTNKLEGEDKLRYHMQSFAVGHFVKKFIFTSEKFSSTSECVGCGVCEKVCPMKNIKIADKRPQWESNCATCLACFHWCPKKAVVPNKIFMKRKAYHHPEISVSDMDLKIR